MVREVVKIDEELCDGCGLCVPGCHEGALQVLEGKARLISDLMCDGLGACLGHCPRGAITIEKREAGSYSESKVMSEVHGRSDVHAQHAPGGCPGSRTMTFEPKTVVMEPETITGQSELRQWPVQMHLVNPVAPYFKNADVLIAADCTAFATGGFHSQYLRGKSLAIACPKLDSEIEVYIEKIQIMIEEAKVNTLTVIIMQVPCCMGLLQMVKTAASLARRKVPVKLIVAGIEGKILKEEWVDI